jgi:hypothetical protein
MSRHFLRDHNAVDILKMLLLAALYKLHRKHTEKRNVCITSFFIDRFIANGEHDLRAVHLAVLAMPGTSFLIASAIGPGVLLKVLTVAFVCLVLADIIEQSFLHTRYHSSSHLPPIKRSGPRRQRQWRDRKYSGSYTFCFSKAYGGLF